MDVVVIFIANYALYISILVTLYVWLKQGGKHRKQFIIKALVAAILTLLLAKLANWIYYNPRPFVVGQFDPLFPHPKNNGFPSDHTLFTSYLAFLAAAYNRKLGIGLLVLAISIGAARVVAGVHHTIDVLAAMVIAGIAVVASGYLISILSKREVPTSGSSIK